jgi:D-alanyl-D-alanine carboxypeptidase (penicillin-binding protein 5/6)
MAQTAFARIVDTRAHDVPAPDGGVRHVQNRNVLLWLYPGASGVKTGFTTPAGHCLVATARRDGRRLIAVVLGDAADSDFDDGAALLNFGFGEFTKLSLVEPGDPVGAMEVGGQSVPVAAAEGLVRLVRKDRVHEVRRFLHPAVALRLPVLPGQAMGEVEIRAHGVPLGTVPVVAISGVTARPPQPPRVPALARAARELAEILRATFGPFL